MVVLVNQPEAAMRNDSLFPLRSHQFTFRHDYTCHFDKVAAVFGFSERTTRNTLVRGEQWL
jgi:hypothetical protein